MRKKASTMLKKIAQILNLSEEELILKLVSINALLLERVEKEGVSPEEFFEGSLYVSPEIREWLSAQYQDWQSALQDFLSKSSKLQVDNPLEESYYWLKKLHTDAHEGKHLSAFTIYAQPQILKDFIQTANLAIEKGLVPEGYENAVGQKISQCVHKTLKQETKILKEKILRCKLKGKVVKE